VLHAAGGVPELDEPHVHKEDIEMNAAFLQRSRRGVLVVMLAVVVAGLAAYAPVALDLMADTALVPQASACQMQGGGC
jgi:hypothetical protein